MAGAAVPETHPVAGADSLRTLWRYRWRIAVATVGVACLSVAYALLATQFYRATVVMVPAAGAKSGALSDLGGLAALAGVNLDAKDSLTDESLAVLHSSGFLEKFVTDHDLPHRLFRLRWDVPATWLYGFTGREASVPRTVRYFDNAVLGVAKDKKTGLILVSVDWSDRDEAASWANDLVARLNEEMRTRALVKADAYTGYLAQALDNTGPVETRASISRLIESQLKQKMIATVTPEYAFRTIDHALPPDPSDRLRPKRANVALTGTLLGFVLVCIFTLWRAGPATGRAGRLT